MKNITVIALILSVLALSGCGTVDASYQSAKGIGKSAIGGVGNIVGSSTSDVGRTFGVAANAAGSLVTGTGKVLGGSLDVAGTLVKGTSDIVTGAPAAEQPEKK
jgi:uncharacterized protein YceK